MKYSLMRTDAAVALTSVEARIMKNEWTWAGEEQQVKARQAGRQASVCFLEPVRAAGICSALSPCGCWLCKHTIGLFPLPSFSGPPLPCLPSMIFSGIVLSLDRCGGVSCGLDHFPELK